MITLHSQTANALQKKESYKKWKRNVRVGICTALVLPGHKQ